MSNPYGGLDPHHFWRRSVSAVEPHLFDPVVAPRFTLGAHHRVSTGGSCFENEFAEEAYGGREDPGVAVFVRGLRRGNVACLDGEGDADEDGDGRSRERFATGVRWPYAGPLISSGDPIVFDRAMDGVGVVVFLPVVCPFSPVLSLVLDVSALSPLSSSSSLSLSYSLESESVELSSSMSCAASAHS